MKYNNTEIRTVNHHGETLYVAKDICDCLGYSRYDAFYRKIKKSELLHVDGTYQLMKCIDKETVLHLAESSRQGINGDFTKWVDKNLFNTIEPKTQVIEEGSVVINKTERMNISGNFSLLAWFIADGELTNDELIATCQRMADNPFVYGP